MSPTVRAFHYVKRVGFGIDNKDIFSLAINEAFWARFTRRQRLILRVKLCWVALRSVLGAELQRLRRFALQCVLYAVTKYIRVLEKFSDSGASAAHDGVAPNVI